MSRDAIFCVSTTTNSSCLLFSKEKKEMQVPSPCKLICRYDEDGFCAGCRRNRAEITNWINYTDKQKLEVYRNIKARKMGNYNV